ncbi:MAG: carbon-nitrogen hydrolase family protein [Planctomycetes bacterium]|nr:carbon-nitrogen hydrolase family protein [Planctomycetota bacterium]MBI3846962.1 carbon-nitrogen hydrolase family protein [Planctomycetota bacterium]
MTTVRVAIVQRAPTPFDSAASVAAVCRGVAEASALGATLVAFPETFVSVYPLWCDAGTFGKWGDAASKQVHAALIDSSIEVPSDLTREIGRAASAHHCAVGVGVNERAGRTLYNALLLFDETGRLVVHRRKLVPTFGEKLVWTTGDAHDLDAAAIGCGRVGGLICWEHWMPLPRQVLHDRGEEIHLALWPEVREMYLLASRHYAFEGRCFVLAAGMILRQSDFPADFPLRGDWKGQPDLLLAGGSAIVAPDGSILAGPVRDRETVVTADLDLSAIARESLPLDTSGHYARPDLFQLRVDTRRIPTSPTAYPGE